MKKIVLSIAVLAALSVGISSCSSKICQTCSSNSSLNYVQICSSDFPDKKDFWDHINAWENSGYTCNKQQ